MKLPSKYRQKSIHIPLCEDGESAGFNLPYNALFSPNHNAGMYSISTRTLDKLTALYYAEVDRSDVLIHDLEDKVKVVELLKRKGVWV